MGRNLSVDDDQSFRELLKNGLKASGYQVTMVKNTPEAMSSLKDIAPDLIIMEVYMPNFDGLSLFQKIKCDEALRDIPILVLSGTKSDDKELLANIKKCVGR